ncbi:Zinc finger CCCH domain-containing protein 42 [Linum perenne]
MNPLTLVKRIQNINSKEASLGISEEASWHAKYKDSAYIYVGGIPFDLTEGDLLAVFAQCGEVVDVNLVRDKGTGKSKGFAFVAYEDQRSTTLAVDNLNGAQVLGRVIRVDHVTKYKKIEEDDEETAQKKREARGVCRAFQRGNCTYGAGCKFSHDEQRAANTGWGAQDDKSPTWGHDKFDGQHKGEKVFDKERPTQKQSKPSDGREERRSRNHDGRESGEQSREDNYRRRDEKRTGWQRDGEYKEKSRENDYNRDEKKLKRPVDDDKGSRRHEYDESYAKSSAIKTREGDYRREDRRSSRHTSDDYESRSREDDHRGQEKSSRSKESRHYSAEDRDLRRRDSSSDRHKRDSDRRR